MTRTLRVAAAVVVGIAATVVPAGRATATSFANATPITVGPPEGNIETAADPYPSSITVSGLTGRVTDVNVTLCGIAATYPSDLDILLVAPNGTNALVMADVGGNGDDPAPDNPQGDTAITGVNVTLDDSAPASLPADQALTPGTYQPFDDDSHEFNPVGSKADVFFAPAPLPADRLGVFRPSNGVWYFRSDSNNVELSSFNGVEPNGTWRLFVIDDVAASAGDGEVQLPALSCGWSLDVTAGGTGVPAGNATIIPFGTVGDVPVAGDYDGNGSLEVAVYRPSSGTWFIQGGAAFQFGAEGDIPVPGDYDGDGDTDAAVFRPANGAWFVRGGPATLFGTTGDVPAPADYDGDDDTDIAVFRPSSGTWFLRGPLSEPAVPAVVQWGTAGDIPVPGDYDRDGRANMAVFRPSNGTWFVRSTANFPFGTEGDQPVPYDYNNDAFTDAAVFRPAVGAWFIHGFPTVIFGTAGDIPLPRPGAFP